MGEEQVPWRGGSDASDDDAAWLAALRGHPVDGSPSPAAMEGMLIREAMLKWPPAREAPMDDPARIDRLLERARAEGLLGESPAPEVHREDPSDPNRRRDGTPPAWWTRIKAGSFVGAARASLAIAAVLVVSTSVWLARPRPSPVEEGSVRTAPDAVVVLRVRDPEASRRQLVDGLTAEGVDVTRYTRFGRLGVDADLPRPLPAGIAGVLQRQGLAPPVDGVLRVEYEGP